MAQAYKDTLDSIFTDLRSKSELTRQHAATKLGEQVAAAFRELPTADFNRYYDEVYRRIQQLIINGIDTHERTGGLYALNALIDFKGDDAAIKVTRFSNLLKRTLEGTDTIAMIVAAKCLGRLAAPGGALTAELVDAEFKNAL